MSQRMSRAVEDTVHMHSKQAQGTPGTEFQHNMLHFLQNSVNLVPAMTPLTSSPPPSPIPASPYARSTTASSEGMEFGGFDSTAPHSSPLLPCIGDFIDDSEVEEEEEAETVDSPHRFAAKAMNTVELENITGQDDEQLTATTSRLPSVASSRSGSPHHHQESQAQATSSSPTTSVPSTNQSLIEDQIERFTVELPDYSNCEDVTAALDLTRKHVVPQGFQLSIGESKYNGLCHLSDIMKRQIKI